MPVRLGQSTWWFEVEFELTAGRDDHISSDLTRWARIYA